MRDREETVYDLARLGLTRYDVERVLRELPAIQRAHESACNWPDDAFGFEKRGDAAFRRIAGVLENATLPGAEIPRVLRQRDPRGCTVALYRMKDDPMVAEPFLRLGAPGFTTAELLRLDRRAAMVAK